MPMKFRNHLINLNIVHIAKSELKQSFMKKRKYNLAYIAITFLKIMENKHNFEKEFQQNLQVITLKAFK